MLHLTAPAKINLILHVTGKQASGFHDLQSLFTFIPTIHDSLKISLKNSEESSFSLEIDGPFAYDLPPPQTGNSILTAATWFQQKVAPSKRTALIRLTKNLPIASGIGGGTSDAAAIIAGLLQLWDISLSPQEKWALVLASGELGADVPVCLAYQLGLGVTFWLEGSGKDTLPIPIEDNSSFHYVLVNPKRPVSTADAFKRLTKPYSSPIPAPSQVSFEFLKNHKNDLAPPASQICPAIKPILIAIQKTPECLLSRLSGSGATCFGLFATEEGAQQAAILLQKEFPTGWVQKS